MATGNRSIHLVTPQVPPKPQQSLDPADIAAAVLETVRDCEQTAQACAIAWPGSI